MPAPGGREPVIGLTGGIASGKSTVGRMLEELGAEVVDADQLAREVVAPGTPGLQEVVAAFGKEVLDGEGGLDRGRLAARVFADPGERRRLERLLHPKIAELARQRLAAVQGRLAVYQAPLIFETGREGEFQGVLLVDCAPEVQLARLRLRDQLQEAEARARLAAQLPAAERRRRATWIVENSGSLEDTSSQLLRLWEGELAALRRAR
ncbi:MAG: dephospho-CoA kinase [Candidatus Dormibacteria bacterium]